MPFPLLGTVDRVVDFWNLNPEVCYNGSGIWNLWVNLSMYRLLEPATNDVVLFTHVFAHPQNKYKDGRRLIGKKVKIRKLGTPRGFTKKKKAQHRSLPCLVSQNILLRIFFFDTASRYKLSLSFPFHEFYSFFVLGHHATVHKLDPSISYQRTSIILFRMWGSSLISIVQWRPCFLGLPHRRDPVSHLQSAVGRCWMWKSC